MYTFLCTWAQGWSPFSGLLSFFCSLVPVSIISIRIIFLNHQMFYFQSLLTLCSVSLPLISPMWHGVTLTLFPKFRNLHEKMFCYLDEKMYLGRWLFPLATFFLHYLLVVICLGWIELTSNRFHLSHSYMSNWYPTTRLYEFLQTRSALSLYEVTHTNCSVFNCTSYHIPIDIISGSYRSWS